MRRIDHRSALLQRLGLNSGDLSRLQREDVERPTFYLGMGTCGLGAGAGSTMARLKQELAERRLDADVVEVGCIGLCAEEPVCGLQLPGRMRVEVGRVSADCVAALVDVAAGGEADWSALNPLGQHGSGQAHEGVPRLDEHPFFGPQVRWVLANCGLSAPTSLGEYVARGGYGALAEVLTGSTTPDALCAEVAASGLRGRGGGGFLTGLKWRFARETEAAHKVVICNADEGDPGAFMDRAVIEGDPHRVVEGMALAAYAIGAERGIFYVRAEYPLAIARLKEALSQTRSAGLLGSDVLGTGWSFELAIKEGAGAFVCGEETALIHSLEGKRGMPRPRPPFPAVCGLGGEPTVINNVETLANLPGLVTMGADAFRRCGTATSAGTKVFALSGHVLRTGLVEVPMGTSVAEIVDQIGGGSSSALPLKAVQLGGPSGGCLPADSLGIPVDYESLREHGAMMGSGGLVVMDESSCMVDVARFFMEFIERESCGKCIPCREGTSRLKEILDSLVRGYGSEAGTDALTRMQGVMQMEKLAEVIRQTSLCGLGQSAPNPVLSTLRHFRSEVEEHVFQRRCPAGVCRELLTYSIDAERCSGCTACVKACPGGAILGTRRSPHHIVEERCVRCGACVDACRFDAVVAT